MNILFVTPGYPKRGEPTTGFPNYLYRAALSLIQLGHKPIILTAGDWDGHRVEHGIDIWTVGVPAYYNFKSQAFTYAFDVLRTSGALNCRIRQLLQKIHIDIIQFTSLYGTALLYREKVPAVLRLSSYAKTAFSSYQTHSPAVVKTMTFLEILSSSRCNAIFAPCKNNAVAFGRDCRRNVKVIETPFINDVQEYDSQFYDSNLNGKKYVLFFGSLYAEKGILVIAEILEKFLEMNPDYYFVFIGSTESIKGESAARILQNKAGNYGERIIISNALGHQQLYPVIQKADFVVLPSLMENLSNACIEAMYFERIVIGTDGASFEQLITHGKNGFLCRIGDSQDLLDKMQMAVLTDDDRKKKMGKLARKRIDQLKPEYAVQRLISLYQYVIANRDNRRSSYMNKGTISVLSMLTGAVAGAWTVGKMERGMRKKAELSSGKFSALFHVMNQWVKVKQDGKNLSSYFVQKGYRKIAVYGMSYVGEALLQELQGSEIEVVYGIDRRACSTKTGIAIVSPEESLDSVDAVVVTAVSFYDEIAEKLRDKMNCPILSIEDVLFEVS